MVLKLAVRQLYCRITLARSDGFDVTGQMQDAERGARDEADSLTPG